MLFSLILLLAGVPVEGRAQDAGRSAGAIEVVDGDTLRIDGRTVDLVGIDAPEATQGCQDAAGAYFECGQDATRALIGLVAASSSLNCEANELGQVVCRAQDGSDLAGEMVRQGNAFALTGAEGAAYAGAESEARAARRGVWAGNVIAPWEWRERTAANPPVRIDRRAPSSPAGR